MDCVLFIEYFKRHVYPGNQGTHDELKQIPLLTLTCSVETIPYKKNNVSKHHEYWTLQFI